MSHLTGLVRHLTVAELRAAGARSSTAKPAPSGKVAKTKAQLRADTREVVASLAHWVKTHPFLQAVNLDEGEASVALLLLWDAEQKRTYPCGKADIRYRLLNFTKQLVATVAADPELSIWLQHKTIRGVLSPGLRPSGYMRWTVRIKPEVGEPLGRGRPI